jgi:acyl carrier protein
VSLPAQSLAETPAAAPPAAAPAAGADLERELADLMVRALNLDVSADQIDPQAPLYGEGLGLDSIDILEVALEVSKRYGFQLRSSDEDNVRIFQSLRSLAAHVAQHRTA